MRHPDEAPKSPVADCSLPADRLVERVAAIRRDILPHVRRYRLEGSTLVVELDPSDATERTLEAWVALERTCCGGLEWTVERPRRDRLRLRVGGVSSDSPLVALFGSRSDADAGGPARSSRLGRLAGALGSGTALALLVCCVAPLAVAAVAGAAAAAPLLVLDDPVVIAVVAAGTATVAWIGLGRRKARTAGGCGCGPAPDPGA